MTEKERKTTSVETLEFRGKVWISGVDLIIFFRAHESQFLDREKIIDALLNAMKSDMGAK